MSPDTVVLQAMRFHTRVGVLPHEKQLPQPVEVDLSVTVDDAMRPPNVVDYVALYSAVAEVMAAPHISYLEEAAERIASAALLVDGVRTATVSVRKPHVPLPGPVEFAQVSITRERNG
ncbi:MAG: dihydroneopterin aldolase [Gemmatimonadaceae bacterium]